MPNTEKLSVKYVPGLHATLTTLDDQGQARGINYTEHLKPSDEADPKLAALHHIRDVAGEFHIPTQQLDRAQHDVSYTDLQTDRGVEYRLSDEKEFLDSTTIGFVQTYMNVPVWEAGITVTVKHEPNRIVRSVNTSQDGIDAAVPPPEVVKRFRDIFQAKDSEDSVALIRRIVGLQNSDINAKDEHKEPDRILRGRFYVYRYAAMERLPEKDDCGGCFGGGDETSLTLPLSPPSEVLEDGKFYVVAEIIFSHYSLEEKQCFNWRVLIDLVTESVLYLRPLVSGFTGQVFKQDPISQAGDASLTTDADNTELNHWRNTVVLPNLDPPQMRRLERPGRPTLMLPFQSLHGTFAKVQDIEPPDVEPPTSYASPYGTRFNYYARTNEFAAVNAYYHTDRFFELVESLGFHYRRYFNGTEFPVEVDHRGFRGGRNAHCIGDGDGIDHCCYGVLDAGPGTLGVAADWRVVLHELGGHGILYEHVGRPNFGFAHSAGDSMAMIAADPLSNAPDRFVMTPWFPLRRADWDPSSGYAWGGRMDRRGYPSEEILLTTLFRIYRSIGGDHPSIHRRQIASRVMAYLILRTVGTFTPATNPSNVLDFVNAMMAVDLLNWTTEGMYGGAYNKVIRWSFERQGLFQPPGATTPVTSPGAPPDVDVYIDDGRGGHYDFLLEHSDTKTIWNRRRPDGRLLHEEPEVGKTNYAYVVIKNRGTLAAIDAKVRGFHTHPGTGLIWPNDFQAMTTASIEVGRLGANDTEAKIIGPFKWTPTGEDEAILMVVSATGDPSNIDHFSGREMIPDWRLVPNDNNVALRKLYPVPGAGGIDAGATSAAAILPAKKLLDSLDIPSKNAKDVKVMSIQLNIGFEE